ncbi:MAG: hypothetical protein V7K21_13465 [Nostoc sp.]
MAGYQQFGVKPLVMGDVVRRSTLSAEHMPCHQVRSPNFRRSSDYF